MEMPLKRSKSEEDLDPLKNQENQKEANEKQEALDLATWESGDVEKPKRWISLPSWIVGQLFCV